MAGCAALHYTELNPVRAGLAAEAEAWPWSSAAAHGGTGAPDACLRLEIWSKRWTAATWREYLEEGEDGARVASFAPEHLYRTRPLGAAEFVASLEERSQRRLALQKGEGGRAAPVSLRMRRR